MEAEVVKAEVVKGVLTNLAEVNDCDEDMHMVEAFSELAEELLSDTPKLCDIMKNYVAIVVGQSVVSGEVVKLEHAGLMAREVLKGLSLLDLPPAPEWGALESNKQGSDQSGLDRVNQLTRYKVARMLHARALGSGAKLSAIFGKKFLIWTRSWITLQKLCDSKVPNGMDEELWKSILENFGLALKTKELLGSSDDPTLFQVDLIFAKDFSLALNVRNLKRREEVKDT